MKKILALLCSLLLILALGACGQPEQEETVQGESVQEETVQEETVQEDTVQAPAESVSQTEMPSQEGFDGSAEHATLPAETQAAEMQSAETSAAEAQPAAETRQISVQANGNTIVFELNDSQAARDLYEQLPLTIEVENYSTNEKIFYPPQELDASDAPQANAVIGTLAYYAPWGDVVMFYGDFGSASGLYELGQAVSGSEFISGMSGTIEIQQSES
mgnify:FL=1